MADLTPANGHHTMVECVVDITTLAATRDAVARFASARGLSGERLGDLVLAANELAINAVRHGGGRGTLRIWYDDGTVWCQVRDNGPGIPDSVTSRNPSAGRPSHTALDGRGLWLVDQMTAKTIIQTGPGGTTVTIAARL
jgi:anti-sigma regulatory factor (Ser/Thr protein kinase)